MEIRFLGHACFQIQTGAHTVLIDPFLTGNPMAAESADSLSPTHLLVTHGHDDHLGDAVSIAQRSGATVFATVETAGCFPEGVALEVGQMGGGIDTAFGRIKFTTAAHGSAVPGGLSCGFLVKAEGKTIYHAGDTGLIMDMALLEEEHVDVALLPIGDRFTMDPADALRAVKLIKPRRVVPMHYNTFPPLRQDAGRFKQDVEAATGVEVTVLAPGESFKI